MDLKEIKRVIQMVEEAQISHLSLEMDGIKIEVKKEFSAPQQHTHTSYMVPHQMSHAQPQHQEAPAAPVAVEKALDVNLVPIKSQMVGTFYAASKPGSPPMVKVGDTIKPGQALCIIEAMKLFNEIESEQSGVIEKICVENGAPVEFGQELFLLRLS